MFLEEAQAILARVEHGALKASRVAQGIEGTLAIGFTSSAAAHALIPRIIRAYRERYPAVELSINEGSARELTEDAIEKRIDVGILRAPVSTHQSLTFHRLLNEEMLLVLPTGHPLLDAAGSAIPLPHSRTNALSWYAALARRACTPT